VTPAWRHYLAMFLLSLSIMALEIAVSRLFSVTLFSHYAFVAVSLAMFGLSLGALVVYLRPGYFTRARLDAHVLTYSCLFGVSTALCVLGFLHIKVVQELSTQGFVTLSLAYGVLSVPFFFGGLCVSLLMTHFSRHIARIYFADLVGASLGCVCVVIAMQVSSAPLVALEVACVVCTAALVMGATQEPRRIAGPLAAWVIVLTLAGLGAFTPLYALRYVKNMRPFYSEYEAWNAFSRVSVIADKRDAASILPLRNPPASYTGAPRTKMLDIDGAAWTPMMNFNGDVGSIQFLRESVLYAAHQLKPNADVLIIGLGGGRDILAALAFGQRSVTGIEINPLMQQVVEERFGEFSGHPYTRPGVHVILDEGRSRLSHLDRTFDVLQLSLIDTFSLNAAGGFVFSENYLYTTEALREYYRHLSPDGILSLTRYYAPSYPLEVQRLAAMARTAWAAEGANRPAEHVVVLLQATSATMLIKRSPFSADDLARVGRMAADDHMQVLYRPDQVRTAAAALGEILTTPDLAAYLARQPYIIDPPTDDRPFFFNFLRGRLHGATMDPFRFLQMWDDALALMYLLIGVVTVMAFAFLVGPLLLLGRLDRTRVRTRVVLPSLLYFACLGYGFMMIEIPLLQRFVLFLGYPVYALAVVLFALLLFSGMGSLLSARLAPTAERGLTAVLIAIMAIAAAYAVMLPPLIGAALPLPIALRIVMTVLLLAPIGLVLGMAYPLGIIILRGINEALVPWAWGLNGALSVVASVLAIFIGSRIGFSSALLTGVLAYGIGLLCLLGVRRERRAQA